MIPEMPVMVRGNPVLSVPPYFGELRRVANWQHRIAARGGYIHASFDLTGNMAFLLSWFEEGLGRRITRHDHQGGLMWDGYVAEMTLSLPARQYTRSLLTMANKVYLRYTPADFSTVPPTLSAEATTTAAEDAGSQALYGIAEKTFRPKTGGNEADQVEYVTTVQANAMRDNLLTRYRRPVRAGPLPGSAQKAGLHVECRGWSDWYHRRLYSATTAGTANADVVVAAINTATGQFISTTKLSTNSLQTEQQFSSVELENAWSIFERIADRGDGSVQWVWGVWHDRRLTFSAVPTTAEYHQVFSDNNIAIYNTNGRRLFPWQVLPDKFIRVTDLFALDMKRNATLALDATVQYISAVEWSEDDPLTMQIEYSNLDRLASTIAVVAAEGARA